MSRSLNIRDDCLGQAKLALKRNGFHSQRALAESAGFSLSTVSNFLRGKPVDFATFSELCEQLSLDWRDISAPEVAVQDELHQSQASPPELPPRQAPYQDWGAAVDVSRFYGRDTELNLLQSWVFEDQCRLVTLLGLGGVGKTSLAVKLARQIQQRFDTVIFRSLRNAPVLETVLIDLLQVLSRHQTSTQFESPAALFSQLVRHLQTERCLLILDNVESILEGGSRVGLYRSGYDDYGQFLQLVGETAHRSCLLLTSREKPQGLNILEGETLPVRCLSLQGVSTVAGRQIFDRIGTYLGQDADWSTLVQKYAGNPLALKIVAAFVRDVFDHDVPGFLSFLEQEPFLFADIKDLLDQQFERLTSAEQEVMYWLAINREPVSGQSLHRDAQGSLSMGEVLQAIAGLKNRSLVETTSDALTLQPVVMEYVTAALIQNAAESILQQDTSILIHYPLLKAQATVSVFETQKRLILQPFMDHLLEALGTPEAVVNHLYALLPQSRTQMSSEIGYFCGTLLHCAQVAAVDVSGYDFSHLPIWQANLQGMTLQGTNFSQADFRQSVFSEVIDEVKAVTFSPDGRYLAISDQDCKVRVWIIKTGQWSWVGCDHQNWVCSVAFSPDSQQLASASADHTLKIWEVETGICLRTLTGHQSEVCSVAFSPTGQVLVSGSKDCTLKLWDADSGKCLQTLVGHQQAVFTVAFSEDGTQVASGSSDKTIRLWDVETGTCQQTLMGHQNWVTSVAFCPHTQLLGSCSSDHTIKLWDTQRAECHQTLRGHRNWVLSIAFSPDGQTLVSSSGDQTVRIWDRHSGQCLHTCSGHHHGVFVVAYSPDGRMVASGSHDQTVRLWSAQEGNCHKILTGYTNRIFAVACSPDGSTVASGSFDHTIRLWDGQDHQCLQVLKGHRQPVYGLSFSPDGQILASSSGDRTIKLWHHPSGHCINTLTGHSEWVYSVAFSPDGEHLVSGSSDHTLKLWQVSTGNCLRTMIGHQTWVWSVAVSPEGQLVASGSGDRTIKLWDINTGDCLKTLTGHSDRVYSVAFSPNGNWLASGSFDHTIKIWDLGSGHCLQSLAGHTNGIYTIAVSTNGRYLVSGSLDHTIKLWDLATGKCLQTCVGHENEVRALALLPSVTGEGTLQMASGSQDQTLRLWDARAGTCQATLNVKPLYDGMNIGGATGLTACQKASLKTLGAIEAFGTGESADIGKPLTFRV